LHAQGVGKELECAALIIIGIKNNANEVIVPGRVPILQVSTNLRRSRIMCIKRDIDVLAVFE
jgi:hypothetical protein